MKFLILKSKNPHLNLAIEEYLFSYTEDDVFMLWQNEPTVVIGKNQNAFAEINMDFIKNNGVHIARRITGGGAVYHDLGNVNYTFIANKAGQNVIDFEYFTNPIIEALRSLGVCAELSGRNDLLVSNKKISGNAQHSNAKRVLHHGTLLFDSELDKLSSALKVDEEKIKSKAIKSTRSRVANIKEFLNSDFTVDKFVETVSRFVIDKYYPEIIEAPYNEKIQELKQRNESEEWIFPKRDYLSSYSFVKKKRYPFGIVEVCFDMSNNIILEAKISGDFFGVKDIRELEELISKTAIDDVSDKLLNINISEYIFGMSRELFLEHIK